MQAMSLVEMELPLFDTTAAEVDLQQYGLLIEGITKRGGLRPGNGRVSDRSTKRIAGRRILIAHPEWSDARIADAIDVARGTVSPWRSQLIAEDKILPTDFRIGMGGKNHYSKIPISAVVLDKVEAPLILNLENAIVKWKGEIPSYDKRPEIMVFQENAQRWSKLTIRGKKIVYNKVARLLTGSIQYDDGTFPWWEIRTYQDALGILTLLRTNEEISPNSLPSYWQAICDLLESSFNIGNIKHEEWARIQTIKKPKPSGRRKKSRVTSPEEWMKIVRVIDLNESKGWMILSQLVLLFPCGLRPSDIYGASPKSCFHLNEGFIEVFRSKVNLEAAVMIDCYPAVIAVFKKWLSIIPEGQDDTWYSFSRYGHNKVKFDKPILDAHGLAGQVYRNMKPRSKQAGVLNWSPYCGRNSFATFAENGGVKTWIWKANMGSEMPGSAYGYVRHGVEDMKGAFSVVPQFIEFDRLLGEHIHPYLEGTAIEIKAQVIAPRRFCSECGKLLPEGCRADKVTCSGACRIKRGRRVRLENVPVS